VIMSVADTSFLVHFSVHRHRTRYVSCHGARHLQAMANIIAGNVKVKSSRGYRAIFKLISSMHGGIDNDLDLILTMSGLTFQHSSSFNVFGSG